MLFARSRPSFPLTAVSVSLGVDVIQQNLTYTWSYYSFAFLTVYPASTPTKSVNLNLQLKTAKQICDPFDSVDSCTVEIDSIKLSATNLYTGSTSQNPCPIGYSCYAGAALPSPCHMYYAGIDCFDSGEMI
jgi:hypothetical protein